MYDGQYGFSSLPAAEGVRVHFTHGTLLLFIYSSASSFYVGVVMNGV